MPTTIGALVDRGAAVRGTADGLAPAHDAATGTTEAPTVVLVGRRCSADERSSVPRMPHSGEVSGVGTSDDLRNCSRCSAVISVRAPTLR